MLGGIVQGSEKLVNILVIIIYVVVLDINRTQKTIPGIEVFTKVCGFG